jgi:hypothetical protein
MGPTPRSLWSFYLALSLHMPWKWFFINNGVLCTNTRLQDVREPKSHDSVPVGVNWVPKGEAPTPQYSSPPKGQRTKEPLRRTTPSSTTANSTTTATTKRRLEKTATTYYFGVLHHLILVSPITMALLYIGMGVDGDFPPSP